MKIFHLEDIGPHYATTLQDLARKLLRAAAGRAPARLPGRVRAHVGFLPVLLRGRLPRAPDGRPAAAAHQAAVPAAGAGIDASLDSAINRIRTALGGEACLQAPEAVEPYLSDFRGSVSRRHAARRAACNDRRSVSRAGHLQRIARRRGAARRQHELLRRRDTRRRGLGDRAGPAPHEPRPARRCRQFLDGRRSGLPAGRSAGRRERGRVTFRWRSDRRAVARSAGTSRPMRAASPPCITA